LSGSACVGWVLSGCRGLAFAVISKRLMAK
jgi:hypothetical protein